MCLHRKVLTFDLCTRRLLKIFHPNAYPFVLDPHFLQDWDFEDPYIHALLILAKSSQFFHVQKSMMHKQKSS